MGLHRDGNLMVCWRENFESSTDKEGESDGKTRRENDFDKIRKRAAVWFRLPPAIWRAFSALQITGVRLKLQTLGVVSVPPTIWRAENALQIAGVRLNFNLSAFLFYFWGSLGCNFDRKKVPT
jgi:hypothetical protein